ncbi:MAG: HD domain-containing phosphohydrolase [Actinomycetota bacterium]
MRRPRLSDDHSRLLLAVGAAAAAGAVATVLAWGLRTDWEIALSGTAVAFAAFVALGDLLEIPLDRHSVFSLGLAPSLAFGLHRYCTEAAAGNKCLAWDFPTLGEVVTVFVLGSALAAVWRLVRRRPIRLPVVAVRLLVVLASAAAYRAVVWSAGEVTSFGPHHMSMLGLMAVLVVAVTSDVVLQSLLVLADEQLPVRQVARDELRATTPLLVSTVSVSALLALAYPELRVWTLPLFLAPLAATQYSFKQVDSIRKNYLQTVRALAKVPEMAGYTQRDHSARVATLAVAIARELGVAAQEVREIEYAALLHDIGRISLPDPEDAAKSASNLQLALVGGEIIEETGHFPAVARMVRDQHEPYRRRGEDVNRNIPTGAKIIKVASAYDDLTEPAGPGRTPWDALEKLHTGMAYDYDPAAIQAMTKVLEKSGMI